MSLEQRVFGKVLGSSSRGAAENNAQSPAVGGPMSNTSSLIKQAHTPTERRGRKKRKPVTVSYTHLTLPTIYSV